MRRDGGQLAPDLCGTQPQSTYVASREGWHLTNEPLDHEDVKSGDDLDGVDTDGSSDTDDPDGDEASRRVRSARRRQDVLDLPQLRVETRTVGRSFTGADGKTRRPSTFLTLGTALDSAKCPASLPGCTRGVDGLDPDEWTPRELRHSFVSLLSDHGLPLEEISRLVGHSSTSATEVVFRKQIRPVVELGAVAMNEIFAEIFADRSHSVDGVDTSSVL